MTGLDWPAGFDRTRPGDRTRNNRFDTGCGGFSCCFGCGWWVHWTASLKPPSPISH